jgi:hypothetical protein
LDYAGENPVSLPSQVTGLFGQALLMFHLYSAHMNKSKLRVFIWLCCFTVIFSSCTTMTGRLLTIRGQACEFDDYVSVHIDQGVEVSLREPVMMESDIAVLMGSSPTSRVESTDGVIASYVFEQIQTGPEATSFLSNGEIEISFQFVPSNEDFLLSGIRSSEIPVEILDSILSMVTTAGVMAQQVCNTSINPFSRSLVLDIDRDMLNLLPSRETVISWLGPPLESAGDSDRLTYEFRLKGDQPDLPVIRVDAGYQPAGEYPVAIDASFSHYHASIDVPAGTMRLKLFF